MAEISIIIPVYNVERYLQRCIDSLLVQTFSDFELILVDDGSVDGSPAICDRYEKSDARVHVIHQENAGPSKARNTGIEWASKRNSKYLAFIDSDDCVHPQYLECLYRAAIQHNVQIAMCGHRYVYPAEDWSAYIAAASGTSEVFSAENLMIEKSATFNYIWGKLYAKECFAQLRFPEDISFGEDNLVIYLTMFAAGKIAFADAALYFYFYNAEGITKSCWSARSLGVFEGIQAQLDYYRENGYERAYQKEIELYIQQCAYQIHRIREDKAHFEANKHHLVKLKAQMKQLLAENKNYRLADNFYWFEALHPNIAAILNILRRIKHNLATNGLQKTLKKVINKIR